MRFSTGLLASTAGTTALLALVFMPPTSEAGPFGDQLGEALQFIKNKVAGLDILLRPLGKASTPPPNPYWGNEIKARWESGKGQHRSPCPMLNVLANHKIIDYTGQNVDAARLEHGLKNILGLRGVALKALMKGHRDLSAMHASNPQTMDLLDSLKHNFIEHDVSLTRERFTTNNPQRALYANRTKIDEFLSYAEKGVLTYSSIAKFRNVVRDREAKDGLSPPMGFTLDNKFKSHGEAVLLLEIIGRNGQLKVKDAEQFLKEERFPDDFVPLPPSSTSDSYIIARILQEFSMNEIMRLWNGVSPADKQLINEVTSN
ncbi:hypothetical protein BDF19DRAFT_455775 [Syncephalis fuscata]|nr:hypothetical protein BDF19DRAFT_455775 [Syncephalis fuscata]